MIGGKVEEAMENTQNTGISARKYGVLAAPRQEGYCQYQYVVYPLHLFVLYLGAFLPVLRTGRFNFKLAPKARHSTRFGKLVYQIHIDILVYQ